jgi:hypothetical protein
MALLLRRAALVYGWIVVSACASPTNDATSGSDAVDAGTSNAAGAAGHAGALGSSGGSGPLNAGASGLAGAGAGADSGGASSVGGAASAGSSGAVALGGTGGALGVGGVSGATAVAGSAGSGGASNGGASGSAGAGGASSGAGSSGKAGAASGGAGGTCAQTVTLVAAADANINAASPSTNYGSVAEANIVRGGTASSERAVFLFDFSSIPSGVTIKSAELELTIVNNPGLDKTIAVHRVAQTSNRSWVESQVTWQEYKTGSSWTAPGGDFVATATDSELVSGSAVATSVVTFQVLSDAQSFYATPSTNFGWLVKDSLEPAASTGEHVFFATRENATADYAPKLVLNYCP